MRGGGEGGGESGGGFGVGFVGDCSDGPTPLLSATFFISTNRRTCLDFGSRAPGPERERASR